MSSYYVHEGYLHLRIPTQSINCISDFRLHSLPGFFEDGLYLSSPVLYSQLKSFDSQTNVKKNKILASVYKYWIRSCSKSVPFGTFAACGLVKLGYSTNINFEYDKNFQKHVRLDMESLYGIIEIIEQKDHIKNQLKYYPNNSIYYISGNLRYAQFRLKNNRRAYELMSIQNNQYITLLIEKSKEGATINELISTLQGTINIKSEDATVFITELIDNQILRSELEPELTGSNPLKTLIEKLERLINVKDIINVLNEIEGIVSSKSISISHYKDVHDILQTHNLSNNKTKNLIQTDLVLDWDAMIDHNVITTIVSQINELSVLSKKIQLPALEDFKEKFKLKYGNAWVPLSNAIDAEAGIGYANVTESSIGDTDLLSVIKYRQPESQDSSLDNCVSDFVLSKYLTYLTSGNNSIEIEPYELQKTNEKVKSNYPASGYLFGNLLIDKDNEQSYILNITSIGGPSSMNLMGRFAYHDKKLNNAILYSSSFEQKAHSNSILAEVVHYPQARLGNIMLRPILREYEIPYIGLSGIETKRQLSIDDLYVNIINNRVVLFSKKHNREVTPRITTAHNFATSNLPLYRFLGELQYQNYDTPSFWSWGNLVNQNHLPRVKYKNLIVQKERWRININDLDLSSLSDDLTFEVVEKIINIRQLPTRVTYIDADGEELLLDLSNENGRNIFLSLLKSTDELVLEEYLFNAHNCIVRNEQGQPFANEVVIPLRNLGFKQEDVKMNSDLKIQEIISTSDVYKRAYFPESEWFYVKLYCSIIQMEKILLDYIYPYVKHLSDITAYEKFFFVRYFDGTSQLRVRFYNSNIESLSSFKSSFIKLLTPLLEGKIITKIEIDTYERELERYGIHSMEYSESLFYNDSLSTLSFLNSLRNKTYSEDQLEKLKILYSMTSIDTFLDCFNYSLEKKSMFSSNMQKAYLEEFIGDRELEKILNEKFRNYNSDYNNLQKLKEVGHYDDMILKAVEIKRSKDVPVIQKISSVLNVSFYKTENFIASIVHMSINRLFSAHQRKYELIIYHFLERHYTSQLKVIQWNKNDKREEP